MSYLSEYAKQIIARDIGVPYYELMRLDDKEITEMVEQVTGRKIKWNKRAMVDGLPVVTPDEIDRRIDKIIKGKGTER